jgi:hypothetical protein
MRNFNTIIMELSRRVRRTRRHEEQAAGDAEAF